MNSENRHQVQHPAASSEFFNKGGTKVTELLTRWSAPIRARRDQTQEELAERTATYVEPTSRVGKVFDYKGRKITYLTERLDNLNSEVRSYDEALSSFTQGSTEKADDIFKRHIRGQISSIAIYSRGEDRSWATVEGSHARALEYLEVYRLINFKEAQKLQKECQKTYDSVKGKIPPVFTDAFGKK